MKKSNYKRVIAGHEDGETPPRTLYVHIITQVYRRIRTRNKLLCDPNVNLSELILIHTL